MAPRRITSRAAVRAAAAVVLVAVTLAAVARSPTAGAIGFATAVGVYALVRAADRGLPQSAHGSQSFVAGQDRSSSDEHRQRRARRIAAVVFAGGVAALGVVYALQVNRILPDDPDGAPPPERAVVVATYHGTADHDDGCGCWAMVDRLTIPGGAFEEAAANVRSTVVTPVEVHDAVVAAATQGGWEPMLLNGALELTRQRQVSFPARGPGLAWLLAAHRLPVALPTPGIGDLRIQLRFDTGSRLRLTAPDKAVSATDPALDARIVLAQGREQVDVPLADTRSGPVGPSGGGFADVVIDVLNPWARIGAVGPALARMQTGGLAAIVLVGTLGLVGVTGKPPMFAMVRSVTEKLRSWRAARREARRSDSLSDDRGYL